MQLQKFVLVFALLALTYAVAQEQNLHHRIYSNVEYNEEGGDLLGTELELDLRGSHVDGTLRIYEGGCGTQIPISGTITHGEIRLSGHDNAYGKIVITGTIGAAELRGTIRLEKAEAPETIILKKILRPHC